MYSVSVLGETEDILKNLKKYGNGITFSDEKVTLTAEKLPDFNKIKEELSAAIADVILKKYGRALLSYYYNLPDYNFSEEEKELIDDDFESFGGSAIIKNEVAAFLENSSAISIDGFVKFRLSGFKEHIKSKLYKYEEKLEAVREYDDLIMLLKAYIKNAPSLFKVINVEVTKAGGYALLNDEGKNVTDECIKAANSRHKITQTGFEELLLSCLVAASPEKITISGEENCRCPEILLLIRRVFEGKVEK